MSNEPGGQGSVASRASALPNASAETLGRARWRDLTADRHAPTRYSRQTPWKPSRHSALHVFVWQTLAVSSLVFGVYYLHWRWTGSLNLDALWLSVPLVMAETAAFAGLALFVFNIWTPAARPRPALPRVNLDIGTTERAVERPVTVDVFFATYDEDADVLRDGIRAAKRLRYPHPIEVAVHLLDDGRRDDIRRLAAEEGANYVTRPDNAGYKAGNMRHAMTVTSGDLIVICDADTVLFDSFLTETLGYFRNPRVAWVQTPQWFWDIPPGVPLGAWLGRRLGGLGEGVGRAVERLAGPVRIGEDPFGNDPQLFYDFVLRRRNRANAAFCCGAASVHRRDALMESAVRAWALEVDAGRRGSAGDVRRVTREAELSPEVAELTRAGAITDATFSPFKLHVSEDIYTSLEMHADPVRKWESVQHPVVVSRMMSPSDMVSWSIQRFKYSGGTLDILRRDAHLFGRTGLTLAQRLMYAATFTSYLSPLWNLVFLFAPVAFLFTGIAPVEAYSMQFLIHIVPFLLLNELAQLCGLWGANTMRGRRWQMAMFPLFLRAGWSVLRGQKISFAVTPKERNAARHLHLVRWQVVTALLIVAAIVFGWGRHAAGAEGFTIAAMIVNTLWAGNNLASLWLPIRAALWRPDPEFDLPVMERYAHAS